MIIGAKSSASREADGLERSTPSASNVPSTVEMAVAQVATTSEFHAAPMILGLSKSLPYQSKDLPR
jgi:hypothetical protein